MKLAIANVKAFHDACGIFSPAAPRIPPPERVALRRSLIDEEVNKELFPAMEAGNLVDIADAIGDAIVVMIGTALEYGIPLEKVWEVIDRANMGKVDPVTGKVIRRSDGKILKPAGWTPPDIAGVLAADMPVLWGVGFRNISGGIDMYAGPSTNKHEMIGYMGEDYILFCLEEGRRIPVLIYKDGSLVAYKE